MPNLNGMPYFKKAFDSVAGQSLNEIEIIVVDAGSSDGSDEYVREAQKRDKRVKLIYSEKKSMGAQYNLGIKNAKGRYVGFCESDDYTDPQMYKVLYEKAVENDYPDAVKAGFYMFFTQDGKEIGIKRGALPPEYRCEYNKIINIDKIPDIFFRDTNIWNGIYNVDFLRNENVLFNETSGAAFQDHSFAKIVDSLTEKQLYINEYFYHYRRDNDLSTVYKPNTSLFVLNELEYMMDFMDLHNEVKGKYGDFVLLACMDFFVEQYFRNRSRNTSLTFEDKVEDMRDKAYQYYQSLPFELRVKCANDLFFENIDFYREFGDIMYKAYMKAFKRAKKLLSDKEKVIIVGAGELGQSVAMFLRINDYCGSVIFCDNNKNLHGTELIDLKVCPVEDTAKKFKNGLYVFPKGFKYYSELDAQLRSYGIGRKNIFIFPPISMHSCFEIRW